MLFSVGGLLGTGVRAWLYFDLHPGNAAKDGMPVQGYKSPFSDGIGPFFYHITLPTLTLSVIFIALIARMTRASVMEVLQEDYIRTARAKGQSGVTKS